MSLSKKQWLIIVAVGMAVCLALVGVVLFGLFVYPGLPGMSAGHFLPGYALQQTPSAHAGYQHTTLSSGGVTYVQDYEDYALRLINPEPTEAIGSRNGAKICAIPGQKRTDYIAADVGSEMPAYEVFRNIELPPFDWRHATFQAMEIHRPAGPAPYQMGTADQGLIAEVIATLTNGIPANPQPPAATTNTAFDVCLFTEQLPGLTFTPKVYLAGDGLVYLAENVVLEPAQAQKVPLRGRWIPAGPEFTKWLQAP